MIPRTDIPGNVEILDKIPSSSDTRTPDLLSSSPILTSTSTSVTMPSMRLRSDMAFARRTESTDSIIRTMPVTAFTLLVCKWPIRWNLGLVAVQRVPFRLKLLHPVFPNQVDAEIDCTVDHLGRHRLGCGQKADFFR